MSADHKIAGCHECPLYDGEWGVCDHPSLPVLDIGDIDARNAQGTALRSAWNGFDADGRDALRAPEWCPLRNGALTLRLVTVGTSKATKP